MTVSLQTNVQMMKGVGPQRAELLAQRGIYTLEDLLNYLPSVMKTASTSQK